MYLIIFLNLLPLTVYSQMVNLASRGLTTIPENITSDTIELLIQRNEITQVENLEGLTALYKLNLNYNQLTAFPDLTPVAGTLTYLYLNYNDISHIDYDLLNILVVLYRLEMRNNALTSIPDAPGPGNTLEVVIIHHNQLTQFPECPQLFKSADFFGMYGNTGVGDPPPEAFDGYLAVRDLDLGNNGLTVFPDLILVKSTLQVLRVHDNAITVVPLELFTQLENLWYLNIIRNQLTTIPDVSTPAIRNLYIGENDIVSYPPLLHMGASLYVLNVHGIVVGNIDDTHISRTPLLTHLYNNHNTLQTQFPDFSLVADRLRVLHLYNNDISEIPYDLLNMLTMLSELQMGLNNLDSIPDCPGPRLIKLWLHRNNFATMPSLEYLGRYLQELYLHENDIQYVSGSVLQNLPVIKRIQLDNNELAHLPDLSQLQSSASVIMYARYNNMEYISPQYLNLTNLNNNLNLYLDNNLLQTIPMVSTPGSGSLSLSLDNNPIVCNKSIAWALNRYGFSCFKPNENTARTLMQINHKELGVPVFTQLQGRLEDGWEDNLGDLDLTSCASIKPAGFRKMSPCASFPARLTTVISDPNVASASEYVIVNVTHNGDCVKRDIMLYSDNSNVCTSFSSTSQMTSSLRRVELCTLFYNSQSNDLSTCGFRCLPRSKIIISLAEAMSTSLCDVSYSIH